MITYIYKKDDLTILGVVQSSRTIEEELNINIIPNYGGMENDYDSVTTPLLDFNLVRENDQVVVKPLPEHPKPPTMEEKLAKLEQEKLDLQLALAESIEKQEIDKINNQLALAELVETLTIKGVL